MTFRPARILLPLLLVLVCFPATTSPLLVGQAPAKPALAAAAKAAPLDLNTATPAELKMLPGIGDAFAKRIIDGRPYSAKNQLTTRGILPQATYDKVKDQIVARRPVKP